MLVPGPRSGHGGNPVSGGEGTPHFPVSPGARLAAGGVPERSKGAVLKIARRVTLVSWVRIPPPPLAKRTP
jgi:hypothetical protein